MAETGTPIDINNFIFTSRVKTKILWGTCCVETDLANLKAREACRQSEEPRMTSASRASRRVWLSRVAGLVTGILDQLTPSCSNGPAFGHLR